MAQDVLITPASTKIAFTDSGDTTTVLRTSSGRFEFKDSGESSFVDLYANDIVLDGNLTVGGTTTTVNTSSVLIEDPILQLAKGQTSGSPTVDIGFLGLRGASNNAAFIWDESDDVFAAILTTADGSGTTLTPASYAGFKAGVLEAASGKFTTTNNQITIFSGGTQYGYWNQNIVGFKNAAGVVRTDSTTDLKLQTNSADRLTINGSTGAATFSGHVGIGGAADTLNSTLHLHSITSGHDAGLTFERSSEKATIRYSGGATEGMTIEDTQSDSLIRLIADDVTVTGNVGIGVASPIRGLDLSLSVPGQYAAGLINTSATGHGLYIKAAPNNASYMALAIDDKDGATILVARGDKKVGIGTNAPAQTLHIAKSAANALGPVLMLDNTAGGNTDSSAIIFASGGNTYHRAKIVSTVEGASAYKGNLAFYTGRSDQSTLTEKLRITGDGKVGINATSPIKRLDVRWSSSDTTVATGNGLSGGNEGEGMVLLNTYNGAGVYANLDFRAYDADARIAVERTASGNQSNMHFITDNSSNFATRMFIQYNGDVGIGTTAPAGKLEIIGSNGTVAGTPDTDTEELVIRNNDRAGIQILSGESSGKYGGIIFGSASDINGANIFWSYHEKLLSISTQNSAGQLAFRAANAAEAMRINANGYIGIGCVTAGSRLHIQGGDNTASKITLTNTAASPDNTWSIHPQHNDQTLIFMGDSTTVMTLKDDGKVGIGTTTPTSGFKLDVNGYTRTSLLTFRTSAAGVGGTVADENSYELGPGYLNLSRDDTAAARQIQFGKNGSLHSGIMTDTNGLNFVGSDGAADITIKTDGKVGIGTIPNQGLTLKTPASGDAFFIIDRSSTDDIIRMSYGGATDEGLIDILKDNAVKIRFRANASSYMTGGSFGIGTTSPSEYLEVNGGNAKITSSSNVYLSLDTTQTNGDEWHIFNAVSGTTSGLQFKDIDTSKLVMLLQEDGNVGIGTAEPAAPFHVHKDSSTAVRLVRGATDGQVLQLYRGSTLSGNVVVRPTGMGLGGGSNEETMWFHTDGKIGIGTNAPGSKLTITGSGTQVVSIQEASKSEFQLRADSSFHIRGAGTDHFNLTWDGKVGIGTTAPTAKLEVAKDSGGFNTSSVATQIASSMLAFEGNDDMRIIFHENGTTYRGMMGYAHAGSTYVGIWDNGSASAPTLVCQTGKVGIGTTAPAYKLDVAGDIRVGHGQSTGILHSGGDLQFYADGTKVIEMWTSGSEQIFKSFHDRVHFGECSQFGIGTLTPHKLLSVRAATAEALINSSSDSSGNYAALRFKVDSQDNNTRQKGAIFFARTDIRGVGDLHFATHSSNANDTSAELADSRMVIKSDGKVGIGTGAPLYPLQITEGSSSIGFSEYTNGAIIWLDGVNGDFSGGDYFHIIADHSNALRFGYAAVAKVSMLNNGSVGIGTTSPDTVLTVHKISGNVFNVKGQGSTNVFNIGATGVATVTGMSGGTIFNLTNSGAGDYMDLGSGAFHVKKDGKVGIGATAPYYKFEVKGTDNNQRLGIQPNQHNAGRMHLAYNSYLSGNTYWYGLHAGPMGMITFYEDDAYQTDIGGIGFHSNRVASDNTSIGANPVPRMLITTEGKVGIGTTAPSSLLHVTKDTANSNYLVYFYNSGSQALDHGLNTQIASSTATAYGLRVNTGGDSNALAVMGDGEVGIGTGAPGYKLDVRGWTSIGTTTDGGFLRLEGKGGLGYAVELRTAPFSGLYFQSNGVGGPVFNVYGKKNCFGVGVTPSRGLLQVAGAIVVGNAHTDPHITKTYGGGFNQVNAYTIDFTSGTSNTTATGDYVTVTWNKDAWSAVSWEATLGMASGGYKIVGSFYNNNQGSSWGGSVSATLYNNTGLSTPWEIASSSGQVVAWKFWIPNGYHPHIHMVVTGSGGAYPDPEDFTVVWTDAA